jgi:FtsP/CotA-like multicopper oxidase with cupredoxin domain
VRAFRSRVLLVSLVAGLSVSLIAAVSPETEVPEHKSSAGTSAAEANDNQKPAGKLSNGILAISLEARPTMFYPEGTSAPGIPVYGFAESGRNVSVPGPLIRVPAGTEIRATIKNALTKMIRIRGLDDHAAAALDTFDIEPGATRVITFRADIPGTFYYWGRTEDDRESRGYSADSQLMGAFIVDEPGARRLKYDRVMVMTLFEDTLRTIPKPDEKEVFAINGRSWPFTERLDYAVGDTVHWRVINFTVAPHPMHLHGFYFDVNSKGNATRDTLYGPRQRRKAVTESMTQGTTMSMTWVPTRPGNWLFHCHLIYHIDGSLKLGDPHASHHGMNRANHAEDEMSGLVMGIHVRPKKGEGILTEPVAVRHLRMYVNERPNVYGNKPGFAFILQNGDTPPARDSITVPSSTVILTKGEPTEVMVINHTSQMASVHWHGIELNSLYDGVSDWSGWQKKTAPVIAPNDSFAVHLTPDRAGTFIYHTHSDETVQLTSGLYGPLLVLEKGASRDSAERILLMGDGGPISRSPSFFNGSPTPADINLSVNTKHRFRLINISAGATKRVRLFADTTLLTWRPIAKDGADLPPLQSAPRPADFYMMPGETYDVEVSSKEKADLILDVATIGRSRTVVNRIPVRVR